MKIKKRMASALLLPLFLLASCGVKEVEDTTTENTSSISESNNSSTSTTTSEDISTSTTTTSSEKSTTTSENTTTTSNEATSESTTSKESTTSSEESTTTSQSSGDEERFNVIFMLDNDVFYSTSVKKGETIAKPINPTKTGYTFVNWYSDEYFNTLYNFNNEINTNTYIYARMDKESYIVNFYNGSELLNSESVIYNELITYNQTPTKEGYVFKGWVENENDTDLFELTTPIVGPLNLYAKFEEESETTLAYASYDEGIYATWTETSLDNVKVQYAKYSTDELNYYDVDKSLIRLINSNTCRVDIVGLTKGDYIIKVTKSDKSSVVSNQIAVENYDRSGYAHYKYQSDGTNIDVTNGIGAYDNNGQLKTGANVIYVTDQNKNSVTLTIGSKTYTGLVSILQAQKNSSVPLCVRIIGTIKAAQYNKVVYSSGSDAYSTLNAALGTSASTFNYDAVAASGINSHSDDLANGITELNGLTNNVIYSKGEYDSYFNMCDIQEAKNVTVEGIGTDATIFQWGFTWKKCSSIEVRNLTFNAYTEDACGFEGGEDVTTIQGFKSGHIWVHHNQFNVGVNNWDVCNDQDKADGDGATDLKRLAFVTLSYNHYVKNHKTGLVGASNTVHQACITLHHNFYDKCSQRMPLGRQANIHMYNNYFYGSTLYSMSLRANCYGFVENCYFEGGKTPIECQTDSTNGNGYAKVYGCIFDNTSGTNAGTIVTNRTDTVTNTNVYGQTFDTDSSIFYYDDVAQKTIATRLTSATQAKEDCKKLSGPHKDGNTSSAVNTETTYKVTFMDGDSVLYEEDVVEGDTISYIPSKTGYQYAGLYTDSALSVSFDKTTKITDTLVLYVAFNKVDKEAYSLRTSDLYKSLNLSSTLTLTEDRVYSDVFTLSKGVRIKNDSISNNRVKSYYNSSTDYDCVVFIDVYEGYTATLTVTLSRKDRYISLFNVNDMSNAIIYGTDKVVASNLASGRYVIIFDENIEPKITNLELTITK